MITFLLRILVRLALALRYRIRIRGLKAVARADGRGILFLPNHPALIDPIIVMAALHKRFRPKALADEDQIDRFFIRRLARLAGVLPIPDMAKAGPAGREKIERAMRELARCLRRGENVLLYPAGRVYRQRLEDLGGNSAVETLLREVPEARVVLVRTRGLWGSSFSWSGGREPNVARNLRRGALALLASGVFFAPRREVTVEFCEPGDLPSRSGRDLNRTLEDFYNEDASCNTYVPYTLWQRGGPRRAPEPQLLRIQGNVADIPAATRRIVIDFLKELSGLPDIADEDRLAHDLGLDSLARSELLIFLAREFGFPQGNVDSLRTVSDVLLAACGESSTAEAAELKPIPARWFAKRPQQRVTFAPERELPKTVTEAFLDRARQAPDRAITVDQAGGVRTYRQMIAAILALRPRIEELPGEHIGVMLPASVAADIIYLATLFAGKTPVMVNWTLGPRNMTGSLEIVGVQAVLTAEALVARLESQDIEFGPLKRRFVYLEKLAADMPRRKKLLAWLRARLNWSSLHEAKVPATAVILFTSGSETLPKAVPLTHANLLTNVRDAAGVFRIYQCDRLLGFLPPFHSFGLTVGMLLPLCLGVPVVHHPSPAEAATLARLVEGYQVTILVGTPTFLSGIARAADGEQLAALRLAVTGAEACPPRVYDALAQRCGRMMILEGYGVTECSPIISVNDENDPRQGTIGKVLPAFEYALVDPETRRPVAAGRRGVLLVRGPCVFEGYLGYEGQSPFVEFDGRKWYRTGDLVCEDADGVLTFCGRLKRFAKIGGEMISLPAIEAVLQAHYASETDEGPVLAVEATPSEHRPELVLFTTLEAGREEVNARIRDAGLSPLHNVRRVIRLDEIPVLGTGKTDYRLLKDMLASSDN